jgi:DNA repair protein RecO (recombination protein O)
MQAAYVLHTRRYGDSSLIAELLTREEGRTACIAKGVLRSRTSGLCVESFRPLLVTLRGRGEVMTLSRAEAAGSPLTLKGRKLYCGLYLNELLYRLTARQDACPGLYDDYVQSIGRLAETSSVEPVLRSFEVCMLSHLGIGLNLERDDTGQPIVADRSYRYDIESGPVASAGGSPGEVGGKTLLALRSGQFSDGMVLKQARLLMRRIIDHHLEGRPLNSRQLFQRPVSSTDQ